jgi:hypothetical protein
VESPERFAEWENAKVGDTVTLMSTDFDPPCDATAPMDDGSYDLLCTRDSGHQGEHVATGAGVVLARWSP